MFRIVTTYWNIQFAESISFRRCDLQCGFQKCKTCFQRRPWQFSPLSWVHFTYVTRKVAGKRAYHRTQRQDTNLELKINILQSGMKFNWRGMIHCTCLRHWGNHRGKSRLSQGKSLQSWTIYNEKLRPLLPHFKDGKNCSFFSFSAGSTLIFDLGEGWFYFAFYSDLHCSMKTVSLFVKYITSSALSFSSVEASLVYSQAPSKEGRRGTFFVVLIWAKTSEGQ